MKSPSVPLFQRGMIPPPFGKGRLGGILRKLFSEQFEFQISNFGHWNFVIAYYFGFGIWLLGIINLPGSISTSVFLQPRPHRASSPSPSGALA